MKFTIVVILFAGLMAMVLADLKFPKQTDKAGEFYKIFYTFL